MGRALMAYILIVFRKLARLRAGWPKHLTGSIIHLLRLNHIQDVQLDLSTATRSSVARRLAAVPTPGVLLDPRSIRTSEPVRQVRSDSPALVV